MVDLADIPGFQDTDATTVVDTIDTLLALAVTGDLAAAAEARTRFVGLRHYLSAGRNPLPAQWSHSVAWKDPAHEPVPLVASSATDQEPETEGAASEGPAAETQPDANVEPQPEYALFTENLIIEPAATTDLAAEEATQGSGGLDGLVEVMPEFVVTAPEVPIHLSDPDEDPATTKPPLGATPTVPKRNRKPIKAAPVYSVTRIGAGSPLLEVQTYIAERIDDGATCPACHRFAKVWPRQIHAEMAKALICMYNHGGRSKRDWIHLPSIKKTWKGRDEAMLRYWGLVQRQRDLDPINGREGWWRITPLGEQYILNQVSVPQYANVFAGVVRRIHGNPVDIHDALRGKGFDYQTLMNTPVNP